MRNYQFLTLLLLAAVFFAACGGGTTPPTGGGDTTAVVTPPAPAPSLDLPFKLVVEAAAQQPQGMPGIHSAAFGESGGKWLFVGGRVNGFHTMFGPDRLFPQKTANDKLWVVDHAAGLTYNLPIPTTWDLRDNLMANNMGYVQVGDLLYFVGGYGSQTATGSSNYTYNTCIGINVPEMIEAVVHGDANAALAAIKFTLQDDALQVTGGEMETLGDDLYLVFGQNYPRAYDGQNGVYTQQIVQFHVNMEPAPALVIKKKYTYSGAEPNEFHRRDLNAVHGAVNGKEAIIAWAGVFKGASGAWTNPILITPDGSGGVTTTVDANFTQKANLYKSAVVIQFDSTTGVLYTSMLGGITNYYYAGDSLVPSDTLPPAQQFPFSNLINTIVRLPNGEYKEYVQPAAEGMPGFLGSNAQFIPAAPSVTYHEVVRYQKATENSRTLIGWMVGGIQSSGPQSGNGVVTKANNVLYEVYRVPNN